MKSKPFKYPLILGLLTFALTFLVTLLIDSPYPFWASLVGGFLVFEISFYHFFNKERRVKKL